MADIKFSQFPAGGNVQVNDIVVGLRGGANYKFTFPGTGIEDASGNVLIGYTSPGADAINHILIENAIASQAPSISAVGTDTNIDLNIASKGTGNVNVNGVLIDDTQDVSGVSTVMFEGSSSGQAILKAQASAGTPTLSLPDTTGTLALTSDLPSFPITLAQGGTSNSLSALPGGIFYTDNTQGNILTGTATADQVLMSGNLSAPHWSSATYPVTTTQYAVLYSTATNSIGELAPVNGAALSSNAVGQPTWQAMQDGEVLIGATSGTPQSHLLGQGAGISIAKAANSITISATGAGLTWQVVSGTSASATAGNGYITSNSALTTISLPASCAPGDMISVQGQGSGNWLIQANTSQVIHVGSTASMSAGSVASANQYDAITLICIVADTDWAMFGPVSSGFVIT